MRHEAKVGQIFRVDIVLELSPRMRRDSIADTISYELVTEIARQVFRARAYQLIEAAAGAVADALLDSSRQITAVRVVVHKPHAPIAETFGDIGVAIERVRTSAF
jgi:7,8-dihydroneopterin aldolase/epimerase/oxygenase